jgi:hypothetical protein
MSFLAAGITVPDRPHARGWSRYDASTPLPPHAEALALSLLVQLGLGNEFRFSRPIQQSAQLAQPGVNPALQLGDLGLAVATVAGQ